MTTGKLDMVEIKNFKRMSKSFHVSDLRKCFADYYYRAES